MRGEKGIRELREALKGIIDFIEELGTEEESEHEDLHFAYDVLDTIDWVLGDISNKYFSNPPYLNMPRMKEIVERIEERTGEKLEDYHKPKQHPEELAGQADSEKT